MEFPHDPEFYPPIMYDPGSDSITCYFRAEDYEMERLNDEITIFRSMETKEIVGCRLECVKSQIQRSERRAEIREIVDTVFSGSESIPISPSVQKQVGDILRQRNFDQ